MITEKDYPNLFVLNQKGVSWLFGMEVDEFVQFQPVSQREYLDLLVMHLERQHSADRILIVDAGEIYEPQMLSRYLRAEQIAYLSLPKEMALSIWKSRTWAIEMLRKYDNSDELFRKWMEFDQVIADRIGKQCRELNFPVILRDEETPKEVLLEKVEAVFRRRLS
jgi:hypothetical protein